MSLTFVMLLPQIIAAGIATVEQVGAIIHALHPGLTDAELNQVLGLIQTNAAARKALADKDAGG